MAVWNAPSEDSGKPQGTRAEPHPEGLWDATVITSAADKTKNGKLMLRLTFKTSKGKVNGRIVHSPESSKAEWAFFRQLYNLGLTKAFFEKGPDEDEVAAELVHKRGLIRVAHRTYQDETFSDVEWIDAIPDSDL